MEYMVPLRLYQTVQRKSSTPKRLLGLNICTNNIGVSLSEEYCDPDGTPTSMGVFPIDSSVDSIAKTFAEWIPKHSIVGLVVGCGCFVDGIPKQEAYHVVRFVEALSQQLQLQGLLYTYWGLGFTNSAICGERLYCDSDEYMESLCETYSPIFVLMDYLENMRSEGSLCRPGGSCSETLKDFTEECKIWADHICKEGLPIKVVYTPWLYDCFNFGWMNMTEFPIHVGYVSIDNFTDDTIAEWWRVHIINGDNKVGVCDKGKSLKIEAVKGKLQKMKRVKSTKKRVYPCKAGSRYCKILGRKLEVF